VPTLLPGDLVIMDNLGSHKGPAIRRAIRNAEARLLLLPKYSPDLNPIEQVFAKLSNTVIAVPGLDPGIDPATSCRDRCPGQARA
jgi:transposase